ncbi:MAG: hypothetical protein HC834_02290 [Rhodospirillales bacterium]|nr:hypothetical protein [Rhodospirillales bacterium]
MIALPALAAGALWDLDGDGMSDAFARRYGLPEGSGGRDSDGDGVSNAEEAVAGTVPTDSDSFFGAWMEASSDGFLLTVRWHGVAEKRYQVERSTDLVTWSPVGSIYFGAGAMLAHTDSSGLSPRYLRITIVATPDSDGDGFDDWEETILGTNKLVRDADADGLSDAWEVAYLGTLAHGATGDPDGDGVSALAEYQLGTNPGKSDTTTQTFTYDSVGRLATVSHPARNATYDHDAEGNIRTVLWTSVNP